MKLSEIEDGTSGTLAVGQVVHDLGPWIAEGLSTARQVHPPTDKLPGTFGSLYHKSGCYFTFCDASPRFVVFDDKTKETIQVFARRDDREIAQSATFLKNPFEHQPAIAEKPAAN